MLLQAIWHGKACRSRKLVVDVVDLSVAPLGVQKMVDPVAEVILHERVYH
jgi:hypothetical protein